MLVIREDRRRPHSMGEHLPGSSPPRLANESQRDVKFAPLNRLHGNVERSNGRDVTERVARRTVAEVNHCPPLCERGTFVELESRGVA